MKALEFCGMTTVEYHASFGEPGRFEMRCDKRGVCVVSWTGVDGVPRTVVRLDMAEACDALLEAHRAAKVAA